MSGANTPRPLRVLAAPRVVIAGGGTGGHLFPGLAVVEELRRRYPDVDVLFVGTERGIESRLLPARGEKLEHLEVTPLKGRTPTQLLASLSRLPPAGLASLKVLRAHRADLVLGVGGYASGPMLAAAVAQGIPAAVMEQNAHLGLTNRIIAPFVGRAYLTFTSTAARFGARARVVGNPVRRAFVDAARLAGSDPAGFEARARTLLVLGGSQGAQALNEAVPAAFAELAELIAARGFRVVHQTGPKMRDAVAARYAELGVPAEVPAFIDDVASAYAGAAVVVCRAGATTLAELQAVGRPSILIPYPHAADDHQRKNAEVLDEDGAARMIVQSQLSAAGLAATLRELLQNNEVRRAMASAARRRGRPEAAAAIVDDLAEWLGWAGSSGGAAAEEPSTEEEPDENDAGAAGAAAAAAGPSVRAARPREATRGHLRGVRPYDPLRAAERGATEPASAGGRHGERRKLVFRTSDPLVVRA